MYDWLTSKLGQLIWLTSELGQIISMYVGEPQN
jgi:hypothetical protein